MLPAPPAIRAARFFSEALPSRGGVTDGEDVPAPDTVEMARHPKPGPGWTESMKGVRERIAAEHEPSGKTKGHREGLNRGKVITW